MASGSKKVIYAALVGNALIAVTKFFASVWTGSSAMFSEGVHSLVDTGNQMLLLLGLKKAIQPANTEHPFGHGKEIYFWSFVVAIMIFAVGSGVSLYEGIHGIINPHEPESYLVNYLVLGSAIIFEGFAWYFAWREFTNHKGRRGYIEAVRKGKNPSLFVVLFEDSAALLGLVVALIGVGLTQYTGFVVFDGIASVIIGLILGGTAIWLAYETKGLLIGESADVEVVAKIRDLTTQDDLVDKVHEVLTLHMGPDFILVNMSVDFTNDLNGQQVNDAISHLDHDIKALDPRLKRVFIEAQNLN
ncbi:MAG: cation diffusion facilitator family transporter [Bacteroidota bacterium]